MCGRVRVSVSCCCTTLLQKVWTHRYVRTYHFMRHRTVTGKQVRVSGNQHPHTPPCLDWCLTLPKFTGIVVISLCSRPPVMRCKVQIGPCMVHGKRSRCSGAAPPTHCSMSHLCVPSSSLHPAYCARRSKLKHSQSSQRYPASWQEPGSSFLVSALLLR